MTTRLHTIESLLVAGCTTLLGACLQRDLAPLNPCLVSGVTEQVAVNNIDKVDLLFMVDNSSSMEDKQKNLRQHVPQLVQTLVTGMRNVSDPHPFPPVKDLHIAVVDSDMGLVGITGIQGCTGFGDDGLFQHTAHPSAESPTCDASYPTFLSYVAGSSQSPTAAKLEQDFGCIANVGAMGCGFEQQLESVLKALWPARYVDPQTGQVATNPIRFLTDTQDPTEAFGHADGANNGFLRNDPNAGLSLLAIIALSDEDDGSTSDNGLYTPSDSTPPWLDPITKTNLNLRPLIGANRDHLYPISRYVSGFKALRPGNEQLVVFAAITGVPIDLVNDQAKAGVDFTQASQRDAFYDRILNDSRMQNVIDPASSPTDQRVKFACVTSFGHATPGRRYIEVAKGMGENATIYSICENDYTPAMNQVIDIIAKQLTAVCLPKPLVRDASGLVKCNVVWELPNATTNRSTQTPTSCAQRPFLGPPDVGHATVSASGGAICTVRQLPVTNRTIPAGDGWYYDNFSDEVNRTCDVARPQRVSFSAAAKPPTGVTVRLECLNETQHIADTRTDEAPGFVAPTIGSSCEVDATKATTTAATTMAAATAATTTTTTTTTAALQPSQTADDLCAVHLANGKLDTSMFCELKSNTCQKTCTADADCPRAWVCDKRPETLAATSSASRPKGAPVCVNPTCGTD